MDDDSNGTGRTSVDLKGVLNDITFPTADLGSLDVSLPNVETHPGQKDLFEVQKRKSWDKSTEARCDFSYRLRLTRRICPVIKEMLGYNLKQGNWCICTSPKRRHKVKNFATLISERLGQMLEIPFYEDVAFCHTKQRVNAVFELNVLPKEPNIIVYDDFVTTGQTLAAMRRLLQPLGKNLVWFTNVNNKL